jgi:hypothetical protein
MISLSPDKGMRAKIAGFDYSRWRKLDPQDALVRSTVPERSFRKIILWKLRAHVCAPVGGVQLKFRNTVGVPSKYRYR